MGDEGVMAGDNCKRYLQNKLVDRKRRRPNSALLEVSDIVDDQVVGDTSTRVRQATRQSTQKHLICTINRLAKTNKTDLPTAGSKKHLRTTKHENEELSHHDNIRNLFPSAEYDTMNFTNTKKNDINDNNPAAYLEKGDDCAFKKNDIDDNKNIKQTQFEEEEEDIQKTFENDDTNDKGSAENHSTESLRKLETINEREYQTSSYSCNTSSGINIRLPILRDLNENAHAPSSAYHDAGEECNYEKLGNIVFENHSKISLIEDEKKAKDNLEKNKTDEIYKNRVENDKVVMKNLEEHDVFMSTRPLHELQTPNSSVPKYVDASPLRTNFNSNDDKQPVVYENELSRLSNSLCSENSSSSNPSCKISMENINDNFAPNESNQAMDIPTEMEQSQKQRVFKSTNETIKSNLHEGAECLQNTINVEISKLSGDEQYHYKVDETDRFSLKSSSATLSSINIHETAKENAINSKYENVCFHQTTNKHDCPALYSSSIVSDEDINYSRDEETDRLGNPKTSINNNIGSTAQANDCNDNKSKLDVTVTSLVKSKQNSLETEQEKNVEKLHESLDNAQKQNDHKQEEESHFEKYLEKRSPIQHTDFEAPQPTHQQHEKDIIDAADKVYTQIEEQYHQRHESSMSTTYEQMMNNHQQQQSNPQNEEHQQRHDVVVNSLQQIHNLQHSIHQQQQQQQQQQQHQHQQQQQQQQQHHYSADQLYQMQQQEHHQQLQMQRHQMQKQGVLQQQEVLQQQQHHNLSANPQQQHSHLMDFLHPQHHHPNVVSNTHSPLLQQQQHHPIHEVHYDLMMDEFHEEHNTPYKLGLSPAAAKHENQDDGYETSAGDVLTPNSHASSTHSVTPQHHMQHSAVVTNVVKCDEQHQQHNMRLQQSQLNTHVINDQNVTQDMLPNKSAANMTNRDPYHFMDDDIKSATNNSLRNILTPPHSHTRSNQDGGGPINGFMIMQPEASASNTLNSNDMYALTNSSVHHHHSQKQSPCLNTNSNTTIPNTEHQHFADASADIVGQEQESISSLQTKSIQKRRGRKKKIPEDELQPTLDRSNDANSITGFIRTKERKKHDRFNGMSEEEVVKRILPDHLCDNLDIVIIGINPGLFAAYKGHHYAGPGNHFWKCLYLSGLTQEQMNADEDFKLIKYGIGFTNMVQRATKGSADLTRKEIKEGSRILLEKLQRFRPKIAVFNGKLIFEVFSGKKDFNFGRQPECVEGTDTFIWVMPSSSARCAQLPRAADKVPFYAALKKFRDFLNGLIPHLDQSECIFTEERIRQQYEQENNKKQQNTPGANDSSFQNAVGISNTNNPLQQNPVGYGFNSESNPHGAGEGPGPPPQPSADTHVNNSFMMSALVGAQHEKKKRGRPKKIKRQEIVDPVTGNKIEVNNHLVGANNGEYANILNLSVIQVPNSDMPKKKRGRPKKVKSHQNMLPQQDVTQSTSMLSQKPGIMSIQSLTSEITQGSPHQLLGLQTNQHVALYSTPPPHQRSIYSPMTSPMASPSLNCSYTTNTPPSQPHRDKLGLSSNGRDSSKITSTDLVDQHPIQNQNFGESPSPSSPNICTVDFEPPTASTATSSIVSENVNTDLNTMHPRLQNNHQRSRFNSPISGEATPDQNTNEHYQQWLSPQPNHNIHSPAAATTMFVNSPQHSSLNYHDQQQQMQSIQHQQQQHQEIHPQWSLRHQGRYDDLANSPYLLSSQLHQTHSHNQQHNQANHNNQSQHSNNDVARKSLSGLESLVDQIPTISESESIALSSAAAVNAQVAAAAAVESRLQGMQNSALVDSQVGDDAHFTSTTGTQNLLTASNSPTSSSTNNNQIQQSNSTSNLLNSNFSVSNLAASSANSNNNSNNHNNYGLASNTRPLANHNAYHHSNLMAAAVLAAAAANTPTNLSTPTATGTNHTSMYMDPHAHLTPHVPVNSIYPPAAPPTHHHHHSAISAHHHHAAAHYGSAQHPAADYATANNPYASTQSNVTTSHTLHMPSPNYPYGYPTASTQSNYSAYPHSHHANHHHGHPHAHHLSMFDRLKPSDITGYSSGF